MAAFTSELDGGWKTDIWSSLDQSQSSGAGGSSGLRAAAGNVYLAQGFTPSANQSLTSVSLQLLRTASVPAGNIWVEIWTDSGGSPSAIIAGATSNTKACSGLTTGAIFYPFTFATPPSLTGGTVYHIVLAGDYTISATIFARWGYAGPTTPAPYTSGVCTTGTVDPIWTPLAQYSRAFYTYPIITGTYPFKTSATDTATVIHTVTISADNATAGTGAIAINANGELINNFIQTQSLCGAITVTGTSATATALLKNNNGKKMWVRDGTTTIAIFGKIIQEPTATYYFQLTAAGGYGMIVSANHAACLLDGTITGGAAKGTFLQLNQPYTWSGYHVTILGGTLLTLDYMYRQNTTYNGALCIAGWGYASVKAAQLGNVTFTTNCVAEYNLYLINSCIIEDDTGTIDMTSTGCTTANLYLYGGTTVVKGGTWNITSNRLCVSLYAGNFSIIGGTWSLSNTAGTTLQSNLCNVYIATCTINITNTAAAWPVYLAYGAVIDTGANITITGTGSCIYGFSGSSVSFLGGTISVSTTDYGFYLSGKCILDGSNLIVSDITATATNKGAFMLLGSYEVLELRSGSITIDDTCTGNGYHNYQSANQVSRTSAACPIYSLGSVPFYYSNHCYNEPTEMITSTDNKHFLILWSMNPYNVSDFITTGDVNFYIISGKTTMTDASTVRTSKSQPWQVTSWGTFTTTFTTTSADPTYEYEVSYDGGTTWGALTAILSGNAPAAVPNGNGLDAIRFTITCAAGSVVTMSEMKLADNHYDSATYIRPQDYLANTGRKIKEIATKRWIEY